MALLKQNRLLVFASDAASANVVSAYAYLYSSQYTSISAYSQNEIARNIFLRYIPQYIASDSYYFSEYDTIVTGTSGLNSDYEMMIVKKAKNDGVKKTITIVDNISNFNMRFSINNKICQECISDEVWIFNRNFKSSIKVIDRNLIYKNNIYKRFIKKHYLANPPLCSNQFIIDHKNNYLLILTEYIYELYGLSNGFDEYDMVGYILDCIEKLNLNIPILLKLHPREHNNKYNVLLRRYHSLNVCILDISIQEAIYFSRVVFSIYTSAIIEANVFQKPIYSIQIGAKRFQKNILGKHKVIKSDSQLTQTLLNFYF